MAAADSDAALRSTLNRLYWEGDDSVNQIADDLGISKGNLYELLEPLDSRSTCPECRQATLVYLHRTARDRETLECPNCAAEVAASALTKSSASTSSDSPERKPGSAPSERSKRPPTADPERPSSRPDGFVTGTAILGIAAGLALFFLLRRR